MSWLLDHLQIVIAMAAAFAYWLNQRRAAKDHEGQEGGLPPIAREFPAAEDDPEEAERTRRIQEEIRRKIAERRGEATPVPSPREPERPRPPPILARHSDGALHETLEARLARAREKAAELAAQRERQQQLDAQMRLLEAQQVAAERRIMEIAAMAEKEARLTAESPMPANLLGSSSGSRAWLEGLRDPDIARRAIVLREVLGPPVGIRPVAERLG